ncbi:MAG: calcium/sodium antiporter [Candidatus Gracilibacteria bacterium]|nr:calcium/sodium antiporter [Candidatus Gracilibacteria bacterium]
MDYIYLVIGFLLLIKGSDILVEGASSVAKKFGISALVIGLTIVAFGSSAPELVINLISGFTGKTELAVSNILGSNISNIFLILGITAIISPITLPKSTVMKEIPFLIFVSGLLALLLSDGMITTFDAIILSFFFILFLGYTFHIAKNGEDSEDDIKILHNTKATLYIIGGLAGLIIGGKLIVDSAVSIAGAFGLTDAFIGVTVIAIGTSLPELAVSVIAALKKQTDMAVGAIVGSNIFNTLWILGATGFLAELPAYTGIKIDLGVNIIASLLIFLFAFTMRKHLLDRSEGVILLLAYCTYIGYLISTVI